MQLTADQASRLIRLPMSCIGREYPNAPGHVLNGPQDLRSPKELHPAFYGCFDWHSAVHSHWTLLRLGRQFDLSEKDEALALVSDSLKDRIETEARHLRDHPTFERMYGWAWALKLAQEVDLHSEIQGAMEPLQKTIVGLIHDYLPKLTYPIRVGTHANTAFALILILDYAYSAGDSNLIDLIVERSLHFFGKDFDYPSRFEPSGTDFLSPSLCEAHLMSMILDYSRFQDWFSLFLPEPSFRPAIVSDREDPQIGHLDGLNLSRAWSLKHLGLPGADEHLAASLPHVAGSGYSGAHWLATYATLATIG